MGRGIVHESTNVADVHHLGREVSTKLDNARARERIMALEIGMIEDHGLTLPPSTSPMHPCSSGNSDKTLKYSWAVDLASAKSNNA